MYINGISTKRIKKTKTMSLEVVKGSINKLTKNMAVDMMNRKVILYCFFIKYSKDEI